MRDPGPLFCFAILSVWLTLPRMPLSCEDEYGCRWSSHNTYILPCWLSQPAWKFFPGSLSQWLLCLHLTGHSYCQGELEIQFLAGHMAALNTTKVLLPRYKGRMDTNICQRCEFRELTLKPPLNPMVSGPGTVFLGHCLSLLCGLFLFLAYAPGRHLWRCHSLVGHWGEAKHMMPIALLPLREAFPRSPGVRN